MTFETVSTNTAFGGVQGVYKHHSTATGTDMTFSVYVPPHAAGAKLPVVWYLSGLTCTHANVTEKGEFRRACSELGLIFVAPDTSPRGEGVPDDPDGAYDFGLGAGFYVNALVEPFAEHYRMRGYIESELPRLVAEHFPVDMERQGIMGHSMGGHGALTLSLRDPGKYKATSAFAPIVSPLNCPWGEKALGGYLGPDRETWAEYDACALDRRGGTSCPTCWSTRARRTIFSPTSSRRICLSRLAKRRGKRRPSGCSPDMTTAIISSPPSWPTILHGMPRA